MVQRDFFAFCKSLQLIELKAIGTLSCVRHFGENEIVYAAGKEGDELFIINRGAVELVSQNARPGAATTVLSRGDIFGETGALLDLPRDHTARACAAVSVQCFHRRDFPELTTRVPSFFFFLSEKLASRLFQARELSGSPNNSLELTGSLANFDVITIYQTIIQSMQTGLLTIADEAGETISTFYFEKGVPRWGRFQHLGGEEAFWQLFLHEHHSGTFAFSNETTVRPGWGEGSAMSGNADEILFNAVRMRDQFEDLRKRMNDSSARLKRQKLNLDWNDPELESLRVVAEEIWQLAYNNELTLAELHSRTSFCDLKIYQTVDELVRTGLFSLGTTEVKPALAKT
ncbi:MAG TPA: cyclic nucleotide-binding domain-containing protein [Chthoniobacterales bacterium]|jgi:CRP-like cAMP-binding protein|nr:cyclic nucleotide-binding domain-containing protein [Chthoniobacterales bacterium]